MWGTARGIVSGPQVVPRTATAAQVGNIKESVEKGGQGNWLQRLCVLFHARDSLRALAKCHSSDKDVAFCFHRSLVPGRPEYCETRAVPGYA